MTLLINRELQGSTPTSATKLFKWNWLWSAQRDFVGTFLPFFLGMLLAAALYFSPEASTDIEKPFGGITILGKDIFIMGLVTFLYGPLIDGPHLWATISRTYEDAKEWQQRKKLFLWSLLAFLVGPAVILSPYLVNVFIELPEEALLWGLEIWIIGILLYALQHINKQHWGFVAPYRRKNSDTDAFEEKVDRYFFQTAIWLPIIAMFSAPWHDAFFTPNEIVFIACHVLFLALCAGYVLFQVNRYLQGSSRNGPKLLYIATILSLYYATFSFDPRVAIFWLVITGTGHCIQYHAIILSYGKKQYADKPKDSRKLPNLIFDHLWLYALLGLTFSFIASVPARDFASSLIVQALSHPWIIKTFSFFSTTGSQTLAIAVVGAFMTGIRLHHFYVDSKIWKVSKDKGLAKNLEIKV
jgi:hypothetical protein